MPTVLILSASPFDQDRLSLNREVKQIKEALKRSVNREQWKIEANEAATVADLRRALLEHKPTVLHFSGDGGGESGLCFEDNDGSTHQTHATPLAHLLHHFKDTLKCVVLNACYSTVQAEVIRQQIDYVIGMRQSILDTSATNFAVAFYDALFAGCDFRLAFDIGTSAINLANLPDTEVPVFLESPNVGGHALAYTDHLPAIENLIHKYVNTPFLDRHRYTTRGASITEEMRRHYGDRALTPVAKVTVISMQDLGAGYWRVNTRITSAVGEGYTDYYVRVAERDYKIDWEATVGFWSVPIKAFLAFGAKEEVVARVKAELSSNYFGWTRDREREFQSILLRTSDGEWLHGYVGRFDSVYDELMAILGDGNPHDITVELANVVEPQYPLIDALLSRTWIVEPSAN